MGCFCRPHGEEEKGRVRMRVQRLHRLREEKMMLRLI